ncbi:MAG: nitroreductase family protein, partial [Myxococcales bacterium]|nr:nitroreductase family protein [Myxococcales bacterium]
EDYAACAAAIQNMQLALQAEGVHSKWGSGDLTRHPAVLEMLGVDGNLEDVVGFIWIGHPLAPPKGVPRPALDGFVRRLP